MILRPINFLKKNAVNSMQITYMGIVTDHAVYEKGIVTKIHGDDQDLIQ